MKMETKDHLRTFLKELPREEPSADFTKLVMERVRIEAIKLPSVYQPLINGQIWRRIFGCIVLVLIGLILWRTYFPGNDNPDFMASFYQLDFTRMLKPFQLLSNALNSISLNFIGGAAAISLLLFADLLYARITEQPT